MPEEFTATLSSLRLGKSPCLDSIFLEFIHHARSALKSSFCNFLTSCTCKLKVPKIWRRALIVAIPKPEKPLGDPKSYRPTSLLCVPFEILERLIYSPVKQIINPLLLQEQAGFRHRKTTIDKAPWWHRTWRIAFWIRRHHCVCQSHSSLWHYQTSQPHLQAAAIVTWQTHGPVVHMIMDLVGNCSFTLTNRNGMRSGLWHHKNGVPQGSVLSPLIFNIYISDLPTTISRKYAYADNLLTVHADEDWQAVEQVLSKEMATIGECLQTWKLNLSTTKMVSAVFHLNNKKAKREWKVNYSNEILPFCSEPKYLGVTLDRSLLYCQQLKSFRKNLTSCIALLKRLAGYMFHGGWTPASLCACPSTDCKCTMDSKRDTHLQLPHNSSFHQTIITYMQHTGQITDGVQSSWTSLPDYTFIPDISTLLEWPFQEQCGSGLTASIPVLDVSASAYTGGVGSPLWPV